jgi:hypothetical protein
LTALAATTRLARFFKDSDPSLGHVYVPGSLLRSKINNNNNNNNNNNKQQATTLPHKRQNNKTLTIAAICSTLAAASCACAAHMMASCSHLDGCEQTKTRSAFMKAGLRLSPVLLCQCMLQLGLKISNFVLQQPRVLCSSSGSCSSGS